MSDSESDIEFDLEGAAERALASLLPQKSKTLYEKAYTDFNKWRTDKKISHLDEKVLLAYFGTEYDKYKASTCWSQYSMLKSTLNVNEIVNIKEYNNLRAWLKRKGDGYIAKKSAIFKKEDIFKFFKEAPDNQYLAMKVAAAVSLFGAMRRNEIMKMSMNDFKYIEDGVQIRVPETKTKIVREFVLAAGDKCGVNLIDLFRKYAALRPVGVPTDRFFITYRDGKCRRQPIGIHTIGVYPKKIAIYLKLENVNYYTGHCFRRSSASFLADTGANITVIKHHGGWESDRVAGGYVTNSLNNKREIANKIMGSNTSTTATLDDGASTSSGIVATTSSRSGASSSRDIELSSNDSTVDIICTQTSASVSSIQTGLTKTESVKTARVKNSALAGFAFENLTNCTFNIYKPE